MEDVKVICGLVVLKEVLNLRMWMAIEMIIMIEILKTVIPMVVGIKWCCI